MDQSITAKNRERQQLLASLQVESIDDAQIDQSIKRIEALDNQLGLISSEKEKLLSEITAAQLTQPSELSDTSSVMTTPLQDRSEEVINILSDEEQPITSRLPSLVPAERPVSQQAEIFQDDFDDLWLIPEDELFDVPLTNPQEPAPPIPAQHPATPPPPEHVAQEFEHRNLSFESIVLDKLTTEKLRTLMGACGFKSKGETRQFMIVKLKQIQRYLTGRVCNEELEVDTEVKRPRKKAKTDKKTVFEWFENFIRRDDELFDMVVLFMTLSLHGVYDAMKQRHEGNVPGSIKLLQEFFEDQGISYSSAIGSAKSK